MIGMAGDEIVQARDDREQVLSWILDLGGLAPDRDQLIENPAHNRVENFALAGKMMEQRRLADAGAPRDQLERRSAVSGIGELLLGDGKNLVIGIGDRMSRARDSCASWLGLP